MQDTIDQPLILAIDQLARTSIGSLYEIRAGAEFFVGPGRDWILNVVNSEIARRAIESEESGLIWMPDDFSNDDLCDFATRLHVSGTEGFSEDASQFFDQCFAQAFAEIKSRLKAFSRLLA